MSFKEFLTESQQMVKIPLPDESRSTSEEAQRTLKKKYGIYGLTVKGYGELECYLKDKDKIVKYMTNELGWEIDDIEDAFPELLK